MQISLIYWPVEREAYNLEQEKFVPVAARTNIICLKVQCDSRLDTNPSWDPTTGRPCAGPSDMVGAIMTMTMFPTLAKSVPSLRYLCVHVPAHPNCSSPLESLVSVSEDDEMRASTYWWKLRGPGDDRVAERLDAAIGERVAAYMSSARYDYTKDLDGEFPVTLGVLETLNRGALPETSDAI